MKEQELKKKSDAIIRKAVKATVTDQKSLSLAEKLLIQIKDFINGVEDYFDEPVRKAHEAHKAIVKKRNEARDPLLKAERFIKDRIREYLYLEEKKRREEEERRKFEQEALLSKYQDEQKEDETKAAETFEQIEKLHEESLKVEEVPEMTGTTKKRKIRWRVTDLKLVPRVYLTIDKSKIDAIVKERCLETAIPGIEVYEDFDIAMKRQ